MRCLVTIVCVLFATAGAGCSGSGEASGTPSATTRPTAAPAAGARIPSAGVQVSLPEGLALEDQGNVANVTSKDGAVVLQITIFDSLDAAGSYDSARAVPAMFGSKGEWSVDKKHADGTWALEATSTTKEGKVVHSINYSYVVNGRALVCSASKADKNELLQLASLCKSLAPRPL